MNIRIYINLFKLLRIAVFGQIQDSLSEKFCAVVPGIGRTLIIGQIVSRINGVFKVVGPFNPEGVKTITMTEEMIKDDLHDGGKHKHIWEIISNGNNKIYAKFTHALVNPNTGLANVPIDQFLNATEAKTRGKLDSTTCVDNSNIYEIDAELVNNNAEKGKEELFKVNFIPDSNQNNLTKELLEATLKAASSAPNYKIEVHPVKLKRAQEELDKTMKLKALKKPVSPVKQPNKPNNKNNKKEGEGDTGKNKKSRANPKKDLWENIDQVD